MKLFIGILAGGSGERLWPLSTKEHPKQLIPFIQNKSLLSLTVERLTRCVAEQEIFVVANNALIPALQEQVGPSINFFVEEPASRNTAPAILLSCLEIYQRDPDAVIAFFPADHFIPDRAAFQKTITAAAEYVSHKDVIATLGLKPTYPATGYGYIQGDMSSNGELPSCFNVVQFHEKPDFGRAQTYLHSEDMFWNAGMFLAKASVFLHEFRQHASVLWEKMALYLQKKKPYHDLDKISVDYAIMEKSDKIVVFPATFEWYDVGNLYTFLALKNKYEKTSVQEIAIDASNNFASTQKKVVVWIGVQDLCVIETQNELLVVSQDRVEEVKRVMNYLKDTNDLSL